MDIHHVDEKQARSIIYALSSKLPPQEAHAIQNILADGANGKPATSPIRGDSTDLKDQTNPDPLITRVQRWTKKQVGEHFVDPSLATSLLTFLLTGQWLKCVGLGIYSNTFERNGVNG